MTKIRSNIIRLLFIPDLPLIPLIEVLLKNIFVIAILNALFEKTILKSIFLRYN